MNPPKRQSYWRLVGRQFRRNRLATPALFIVLLLFAVAIFAPFLAGDKPIYLSMNGKSYIFPNVIRHSELSSMNFSEWKPGPSDRALYPPIPYPPEKSSLRERLQGPNGNHLLGTDDRGRDVFSRLIWGTRISMSVGFVAVGIAVAIGLVAGALAGFYGGIVDMTMQRVIEIVMCFPTFILILSLIAFLPPSIYNIMIIIGVTGWTSVARLIRGEFFRLRECDFAVAARATGLSDARIMFRHLLPNALSPVLVSATFGIAGAILTESALSFLGFGVPPPTPSWGELLSQSQRFVDRAWWLVTFPGLAIFITVTAFNLVGEGLRDAMDPKLRQ
jgi:peptide/nickel transport system permease protein